jgi:hypothetical protein
MRFPFARATSRPARTLCEMRTRSCLAAVAMMASTASLKIPQESKYCSVKLRGTPHLPGRDCEARAEDQPYAGRPD